MMAETSGLARDAEERDTTPKETSPAPSSSPGASERLEDERLDSLKAKVTCPRCHEMYSEDERAPKLLPCLHHVCKPCLGEMLQPNSPEPFETITPSAYCSLTCPQCEEVTPCERDGASKAFQTSPIMCEWVGMYSLLRKCSQAEVHCEMCVKESTAVEYCYSCGKFACDFCCQIHQRWPGYSSHDIVPVGDLLQNLKDFRLPKSSESLCSTHQQKLRLYCETCRSLICHDCTIRPHQGHRFDLITDETIAAHKAKVRESLESLSQLAQQIERESSDVQEQVDCINDEVSVVKAEISSAFEEVQEALEQRKKDLISKVEDSAQEPCSRLNEQAKCLQVLRGEISRCREFVDECLQSGNATALLSVEQTVSRKIEAIDQQVRRVPSVNGEFSVRFRCQKDLVKRASYFGRVDCKGSPLLDRTSSWQTSIISSSPDSNSWESLQSQVVHPFCRSLFMHSQHLYVSADFDLSSDLSLSQDQFEMSSTSAEQSLLGSTDTMGSCGFSTLKVPKFFGIAVRTIEGIKRPSGISVTSRILVTEFGQHQISDFDFCGQKLRNYCTEGSRKGQLMYPHSIAVDRDGKMLVTDVNYRLQMLSSNGRFSRSVGTKGSGRLQFRDPTGVAISTNVRVFVSERENHRIHVLNSDLSFHSTIGKRGDGEAEFNYPSGIAVDGQGYLYIADTFNHRVQVLTEDGNFVRQFGGKGKDPGKLRCPSHVCVDQDGSVYVSEIMNHRVSVFLSTGEFVMALGQKGNGLGQFLEPRGVAVDANRALYVCDFGNNRIQVFK